MPTNLAIVLHEYREYVGQLRAPISEDDLVFTWDDGRPMLPFTVSHAFRRIARRMDLHGVRLHDLRHTNVSLMLREGIHPQVVQERLGHSTIAVTLDTYSHVAPTIQKDAAYRFDKAMSGVLTNTIHAHTSETIALANRYFG